jgi:cytochrome P450
LTRVLYRDLGATLVEAGADSTASFLHSLVLALVNFPEVQRLAQEEIDRVVGDERSPLLDDIERLPYIQAVIKEVSFLHYQNCTVKAMEISRLCDGDLSRL